MRRIIPLAALMLLLAFPPAPSRARDGDPPGFKEFRALFAAGKYAEADTLLTTLAIRTADEEARARYIRARGITRMKRGRLKAAREDLEASAARWPTEPDTHAALGETLLRLGDWHGARAAYDRAIDLGGVRPANHANRSLARLRTGQYPGALEDIGRAIDLAPAEDAGMLTIRAEARMILGHQRAALADLDRALALSPALARAAELRAKFDGEAPVDGIGFDPAHPLNADLGAGTKAAGETAGDGKPEQGVTPPGKVAAATPEAGAGSAAAPAKGKGIGASTAPIGEGIGAEVAPDPVGVGGDPAMIAEHASPGNGVPAPEAGMSVPDPFAAAALAAAPAIRPPPAPPAWLVDFDGFVLDDPCNPAVWSMKGAPWGGGSGSAEPPIPDPAFDPARARDDTMRAMEVVRRLAGPFDERASRKFDLLWAPFFDHPTPETAAWFAAAAPLLNDYMDRIARIARAQAETGEAAREAARPFASGDDEELVPASMTLAAATARFTDLARAHRTTCDRLAALGDPPNPLQGKCRARRRHAKALEALAPAGPVVVATWPGWGHADRLCFSRELRDEVKQLAVRGGVATRAVLDSRRKRDHVFLSAFRIGDTPVRGRYIDYGSLDDGGAASSGNPFGADAQGGLIDSPELHFSFQEGSRPEAALLNDGSRFSYAPGMDGRPAPPAPAPVIETRTISGYPATVARGFGGFDFSPAYLVYLYIDAGTPARPLTLAILLKAADPSSGARLFSARDAVPTEEGAAAMRALDAFADHLRIERRDDLPEPVAPEWVAADAPVAAPPAAPPPAIAAASAGPDPEAERRERLAEHEAVIAQYGKFIARAEAERAGAAGDRAAALDREIESYRDDIEAERMYMRSLETGKAEYWRPSFAVRQAEALEEKCRAEVAALAAESVALREAQGFLRLGGRLGIGAPVPERLDALSAAVKAPDRGARLAALAAAWRTEAEAHLAGQREVARTEAARGDRFERFEAGAAVLKTGCDLLLLGGSLFAGPPAAQLMLGYAGAGGCLEGGIRQGLLDMARFKWDAVDVLASAREGYFREETVTTADGGRETRIRGAKGAVSEGFQSLLLNLGFNRIGELVQARKAAKAKARAAAKPDPAFEKHLDAAERLDHALAQAKSPEEKRAALRKFEIVGMRDRMRADMATGAPLERVAAKPEFAEWNGRRVREHDTALAACGMGDAHYSGGKPSTPLSDIDVTPPDDATGRRFVERLKWGGDPPPPGARREPVHHVLEFDDRWVITDTDTTVWKRSAPAGAPGSSAASAETALKAQAGSDMFATPGGLYFTTKGKLGAFDPEGAFLDNFKKLLDATAKRTPDHHAVGKSVDKILEVVEEVPKSLAKHVDAGLLPPAQMARLRLRADPARLADLRLKSRALRSHRTPLEAGIEKPGMSPEERLRAFDEYLGEVRTLLGEAHEVCATASGLANAGRTGSRIAALARGDMASAAAVRNAQAHIASTNAAMTKSLLARDPDAVRPILGSRHADAPPPPPPPASRHGYAWLLPPRDPPPPRHADDPALRALAGRMAAAAATLRPRIAALPIDHPDRPHLVALMQAFESGGGDPLRARGRLRLLTGHDPTRTLLEIERLAVRAPAPAK